MADTVNQQRFNIDSFRSSINDKGYHRTSHFTLMLNTIPPEMNNTGFSTIQEDLIFRVDSASVPGVLLATTPITRYGIGPDELKPYAPTFDKLNITVIDDQNGMIFDFFQQWFNLIINFDVQNGLDTERRGAAGYTYEVAYKEDYAVDISIKTYNQEGEEIINTVMRDAFPIFLGSINMNWGTVNEIVKIPVSFAFTDWYQILGNGGSNPAAPQPPVRPLDYNIELTDHTLKG